MFLLIKKNIITYKRNYVKAIYIFHANLRAWHKITSNISVKKMEFENLSTPTSRGENLLTLLPYCNTKNKIIRFVCGNYLFSTTIFCEMLFRAKHLARAETLQSCSRFFRLRCGCVTVGRHRF